MKKTVAVICEYNPFHLGHKYLIDKVRERYGADCRIIALMSGHFVQRGEPAILDKFVRAKAAVLSGVDLVLEYPFPFCVSGAEYFARFGVSLLSDLKIVDVLAFGSESARPESLERVSDALLSDDFEEAMARCLRGEDKGDGYAKKRAAVLCERYGADRALLSSPNDILAAEYIRAIKRTGSDMVPCAVLR